MPMPMFVTNKLQFDVDQIQGEIATYVPSGLLINVPHDPTVTAETKEREREMVESWRNR